MERCTSVRVPVSHFTRVWRKQFSKSIHNLNRGNQWKATIFLTGHVALNYHLNKNKPDKMSKTCPYCLAAEETTNHYIGQCPNGLPRGSQSLLILSERIRSNRRFLYFLLSSSIVLKFTYQNSIVFDCQNFGGGERGKNLRPHLSSASSSTPGY